MVLEVAQVKHVRFVWDDTLHAEVRTAAFKAGVSMAEFVETALREKVGPKSQKETKPRHDVATETPKTAPKPEPARNDPQFFGAFPKTGKRKG